MKIYKNFFFASLCMMILIATISSCSDKKSGFTELDQWAEMVKNQKYNELGFPGNQNIQLEKFYKWYIANGLECTCTNNAGDPFSPYDGLNTLKFEKEVIEYFAPMYGFSHDDLWGIVTNSGTDGNNHGIYFGVNYFQNTIGKTPILYVSDEAHYSNMRLADLQNLEVRLIKTDNMGRMIPEELENALDTSRPCLIVFAMGSTFKGAIDDQESLNAVLAKYPEMPVYRHIDAALFGGYLPFTKYNDMVNRNVHPFNSIAISGHKFFGMDEPAGIFITTKEIYDNQDKYEIAYLNKNMKMINCSRSATDALKFWWLIKNVGKENWSKQATQMLDNTAYLKEKLQEIGWPCWANDYSNTIFFKRPSDNIVAKYDLSNNYDELFGGHISHIVVMQHVTKEKIDAFVEDLKMQ